MTAEPALLPVTTPPLTVATAALLVAQITSPVAPEGVSAAVSVVVPSTAIVAVEGVTVTPVVSTIFSTIVDRLSGVTT